MPLLRRLLCASAFALVLPGASAAAATITEFPLPSSGHGPLNIAAAPGGNKLAGRTVAKTIHARRRATYTVHLSKTSVASIAKRSTTLRTVAVSNTPYGRTNSTRLVRVPHQEKHKA